MKNVPQSLSEAIVYFANPDNCLSYLVGLRWPDGVACPTCGNKDVHFIPTRRLWECKTKHPKRQFSVKVGTIFEDSALGLDKWLCAVWMLVNCKNGVSSYEISRDLRITQKSAWFMLHRIRLAMQSRSFGKLGGGGKQIEVDETFIGGKARNMHLRRRRAKITGTGASGKAFVVGVLERGGNIRTEVVETRKRHKLHQIVHEHVVPETPVFTDKLLSYKGLENTFAHEVIDHAEGYVRGQVHTNGLENFWSLLKLSLGGTYVSVGPFHLFRYLDEQTFRYNNRKSTDAKRFNAALKQIAGRRLTFEKVTGNSEWRLGQPTA